MIIIISISKAKAIGHTIRRAARAAEFAPLDDLIAKKIPGTDAAAIEADRQAVRDKYALLQTQIDAAATADEIKAVLPVAAPAAPAAAP